jgi:recombination protein RecA
MSAHRQRKLDALVAHLQVQYGPRSIHRDPAPRALASQASAAGRAAEFPHISTSFPDLDAALGIGGLPCGRISEITGLPTSGKLTLAAKVLSAAHREREALVAWMDLSRTCDPDYMDRCGIALDRLLVVRPAGAVDALPILLHLVESNTLAALVFDGLSDLRHESESQFAGTLERLATVVTGTQTAVIFLSEPHVQFRTLAHVATVRLEIHREHWITLGQDVRGYESYVKVLKHKLGRAGAEVPLRIVFDGTLRGDGL